MNGVCELSLDGRKRGGRARARSHGAALRTPDQITRSRAKFLEAETGLEAGKESCRCQEIRQRKNCYSAVRLETLLGAVEETGGGIRERME